jgi:hypothetical protein
MNLTIQPKTLNCLKTIAVALKTPDTGKNESHVEKVEKGITKLKGICDNAH